MWIGQTPKAAEKTFYESFEAGDLPTMTQVWVDTSDICFIHPLGKALCGPAAVRKVREGTSPSASGYTSSWSRCSAKHGRPGHKRPARTQQVEGNPRPRPPMIATNVYRLTPHGLRMVLHHASPAVVEVAKDDPGPQVLH